MLALDTYPLQGHSSTIPLPYFFNQLIDGVYRIFELCEGPAHLLLVMTITAPYGGKIFTPSGMDGFPVLIFKVWTTMGLDGIETLDPQNIFTKGILPPEWMSRHTDSP